MTTFTGDLNIRTLDSAVTAVNIQRGGGATFTGPVVFTSSVAVSGVATFGSPIVLVSGVFVSALANVTAEQPVILQTITSAGGNVRCRGTIKVTVEGTTAFIPFWYGGQ